MCEEGKGKERREWVIVCEDHKNKCTFAHKKLRFWMDYFIFRCRISWREERGGKGDKGKRGRGGDSKEQAEEKAEGEESDESPLESGSVRAQIMLIRGGVVHAMSHRLS